MSYRVSFGRMDLLIKKMQSKYIVFAPRYVYGRNAEINTVRYAQINAVSEIAHEVQSDFSPKEVLYPIIQTMAYFYENTYRENETTDERGILLFARPCDINGIRRLDTIFLKNGGHEDSCYKRLRDRLKIVLLECREGWDTCFCVSMNSNTIQDYDAAVRINSDHVLMEIRDDDIDRYFRGEEHSDFTPEFVLADKKQVAIPAVDSANLKSVYEMDMWKDFADKCHGCGRCTAVCISCSCFTTTAAVLDESGHLGERQRVWASCMDEDFTLMAGGHAVRKTLGERLRFRILHKIYDYKARFGKEQMCVGCGRCISRCPENISIAEIMGALNGELEKNGDKRKEGSGVWAT